MILPRVTAGLLALAVLAPVGCSDDGPKEGEARLEVEGEAVVERRDGGDDVVRGRTDVGPGDRIEITEGTATLALRDGLRLELRAGETDAGDSRLVMGDVPILEAGDLLVVAASATTVEAAGTQVTVSDGAARVSRALGVRVAAYDAQVALDSAGQERQVRALREMLVPALGRPPQAPKPLAYDNGDSWDRRFLGEAIDLGKRLENLAGGYTNNLNPGEGRTPGFFRLVLPGLEGEADFGPQLIDLDRSPGETLIGAAIADLGRRGSFVDRWGSVFGFRDQGAEWGLVALDQAVSGTPLLGTIEQAVTSSPLGFVEPEVAAPPTTSEPTAPPTSTSAPPTTSPPTTNSPPPTTAGPPTTAEPPEQSPLTPPLEPVVEPVAGLVEGLVDGLLGLLTP